MAARSEDTKAPRSVVAFAHNLFELNNRGKYGCSLLWPKGTDLSELKNLAAKTAIDEWGEKAKTMIENKVIKTPFLDGDGPNAVHNETGERYKGFAGTEFIRCVSGKDFKPKVFDKKRNLVMEKADCPSGSIVIPVINAFAWTNDEGGKGVSFGISMLQIAKVAEGDEILGGAGGPDPDKFLETLADEGDAPAETKSGSGAAGLFG